VLKFRVPLGLAFIALLAVGLWLDGVLDRLSAPGWWPAWLAGGDGTLPASILVLPVLLFLCVLVSRELSRILRAKQVEASTTLTCGLAIVGLLVSALAPEEGTAAGGIATSHTAMALVLVGSLVAYARHRRTEGLVAAAGGALLAYAYIGVLLGFWGALRRDHSEWVLFWLLLTTKASDIGAFFAGRAFGKRKMAPWLSPGKTWEGFAGGVAMSAIALVGSVTILLPEPILDRIVTEHPGQLLRAVPAHRRAAAGGEAQAA